MAALINAGLPVVTKDKIEPQSKPGSTSDLEHKRVDDLGIGIHDHQMLLGGKAETKLVRKLDLHIIPGVMLLYLLSFLDRYVEWLLVGNRPN